MLHRTNHSGPQNVGQTTAAVKSTAARSDSIKPDMDKAQSVRESLVLPTVRFAQFLDVVPRVERSGGLVKVQQDSAHVCDSVSGNGTKSRSEIELKDVMISFDTQIPLDAAGIKTVISALTQLSSNDFIERENAEAKLATLSDKYSNDRAYLNLLKEHLAKSRDSEVVARLGRLLPSVQNRCVDHELKVIEGIIATGAENSAFGRLILNAKRRELLPDYIDSKIVGPITASRGETLSAELDTFTRLFGFNELQRQYDQINLDPSNKLSATTGQVVLKSLGRACTSLKLDSRGEQLSLTALSRSLEVAFERRGYRNVMETKNYGNAKGLVFENGVSRTTILLVNAPRYVSKPGSPGEIFASGETSLTLEVEVTGSKGAEDIVFKKAVSEIIRNRPFKMKD